jgi:hypothetical protein
MMFNVPQFIDVEDKVAGPLTVKQLLWMIGMASVILIASSIFPAAVAIAIAVPVAIIFVLLAFYRPNGQPLAAYIAHAFFFLFRPKVLVWRRPDNLSLRKVPVSRKQSASKSASMAKTPSRDEIRRVAEMMDGR